MFAPPGPFILIVVWSNKMVTIGQWLKRGKLAFLLASRDAEAYGQVCRESQQWS